MTGDERTKLVTGEMGQAALDQIVRALAANVSVGRKMSALEDRRWQESVARIALEIAEVDVARRLALSYGDGYRTGYRDGHPSERLALDRVRMSATADRSPTTADPRGNPPRVAEQGGS